MGKVESSLLSRLQASRDATVRLIVRVDGDLSEAARALSARGARVSKTLDLINALVVTCRAKDVSELARQRFVRFVEEDRAVKTQSR